MPRRAACLAVTVVLVSPSRRVHLLGSLLAEALTAGAPAAVWTAALSCTESFEIKDVSYVPWCAGVRPALLGDVVARRRSVAERYLALAIHGVPAERAVALSHELLDGVRDRLERECGAWRFMPASTTPQ